MDESEASLLEIGKLILILHEEFLKDCDGPTEILLSLYKLIDDFGLSQSCSVLDIELIRRKCMGSSKTMDFELFFNFLKLFADFIFSLTIGNKNLSFLSLFSEFIVPYCQRGGQSQSQSQSPSQWQGSLLKPCSFSHLDVRAMRMLRTQALDTAVNYRQFLMHLYIRLHSSEYHHTELRSSWRTLCRGIERVSLEGIVSHFKLIDFCPISISENVMVKCMNDILSKDLNGASITFVSFPLFLYYIEQLSLTIPLTVPSDATEETVISLKLENMMVLLINNSFNYMLKNFVIHDQVQMLSMSSPISDINSCNLTLPSIFWLLRQTNLIQSEDLNLSELYNFIKIELSLIGIEISEGDSSHGSNSNSNSNSSNNNSITAIPVRILLPLLNQLVYKILHKPNLETMRRTYFQLQDRQALFLATNLPSAIFASPKRVPSSLYALYCIGNLNTLTGIEVIVSSILATFSTVGKATANNNSGNSNDNNSSAGSGVVTAASRHWSINSFLDICKRKCIIPGVIYENLVLKASDYVFGKIVSEQDSKDIIRSFIDIFEILFVLAQFVTTTRDESNSNSSLNASTPTKEITTTEGVALRNFNSLLRTLCQNLEIGESDILKRSSSVTSSAARIQRYADKSSEYLDQQASVIASAVSKVSRGDGSGENSGNSLRDVIVLLIHFPYNSYRLNPWEIAQIFLSMSKYNEVNFVADPRISLSQVFKKFCRQHSIRPEDLARFFAYKYEKVHAPTAAAGGNAPDRNSTPNSSPQRMIMKDECKQALADPLLDFVLADRTLRLLYANSDLMKWEFSRAFASYRQNDPFFESNVSPVLCAASVSHNGDRVMLSPVTAVTWACRSFNLSKELAESCFVKTCVLIGDTAARYMPFSSFIIFSIRCYWTRTCNKLDITLEDFVDLIRGMLQVFSDSLTRVQQSIRLCILVPLIGGEKGVLPFLSVNERVTVAKMAAAYFESKLTSSTYFNNNSTIKFLNPRPPLRMQDSRSFLCDVPRFVEFSKLLGLHQFSDTILCSWFCFGTFIRSLNPPGLDAWPDGVVPPLPINLDYLAILNMINALVHIYGDDEYFVKESDGSIRGIHLIIAKYILPLLCNVHAIKTDPVFKEIPLIADNSIGSFEDILRYGGDQVIKSLDGFRIWIEECYNNLIYSSFGKLPTASSKTMTEPPVNIVCSYLSLHGMLKIGTVAIMVKNSLNPRVRPVNVANTNNSGSNQFAYEVASISLSEFEEIIIRCAFHAWDVSGAGFSKPVAFNLINQDSPKNAISNASSSKNGFNQQTVTAATTSASTSSSSGPNSADLASIAERYCRECAEVIASKPANSRQTWGINFLRPFILTAQEFGYFAKIAPVGSAPVSSGGVGVSSIMGVGRGDSVPKALAGGVPPSTSDVLSENILESHLQARRNDLMSLAQGPSSSTASNNNNSSNSSNSSTQAKDVKSKHMNLISQLPASSIQSDSSIGTNPSGTAPRSDDLLDLYRQRLNHSFKDPVLRRTAGLDDDDHQEMQYEIGSSNSSNSTSGGGVGGGSVSSSRGGYSVGTGKKAGHREAYEENNTSLDGINFLEEDTLMKYFPPLNMLKKTITSSKNYAIEEVDENDGDNSIMSKDSKLSTKTPLLEAIENLLMGTKEALWPVFATYCSCGDSMEPGKLSGPNLFTLLSKLGVLSDLTVLSDVGILLHQISAHTPAHSPLAISSMTNEELCETPSLTFEEFLIFLCAFSQLRFEGQIIAPLKDESLGKSKKRIGKEEQGKWFEKWQAYMCKSRSFRRLLEECVLPVLNKHPVIASPEHARHRDRYSTIFSLDVLTAIEGSERPLQNCFRREKELAMAAINRPANAGLSIEQAGTIILNALQRINLGNALQSIKLDHILETSHIIQLVADVMPTLLSNANNNANNNNNNNNSSNSGNGPSSSPKSIPGSKFTGEMCFPQWEWILCVVAYEAVDIAVRESSVPTPPEQVPSLMADLITSIAGAMKASMV